MQVLLVPLHPIAGAAHADDVHHLASGRPGLRHRWQSSKNTRERLASTSCVATQAAVSATANLHLDAQNHWRRMRRVP